MAQAVPADKYPVSRLDLSIDWLRVRFELSRGAGHNVRAMEGLRGLAVFLVFFVHYGSQIAVYLPAHSATAMIAGGLKTMGNAGVDLFFVLSGYLIYGKLLTRPQSFLSFMRRRVERIYPTFLAVFALYVVFSFLHRSDDKIPHALGPGALYLVENLALLPGLFQIQALITQAWSLSYEIFFYLVLPVVIAAVALRRWRPHFRVLLFLTITVGFVIYCSVLGGHVRLIMFAAGMLLFEVIREEMFSAVPWPVAVVSAAAALGFLLVPLSGAAGYSLQICALFVGFFLLCQVCFTRPETAVTRGLQQTPVRWFGNMSYSYYLGHGLVLKATFLALAALIPTGFHFAPLFWLLLPLVFVATVLPTAVLFLVVERPLSLSPALEKRSARQTGGDEPAVDAESRPLPVKM